MNITKLALVITLATGLSANAKVFPSVKTNNFTFSPLTAAEGLVFTSDNNGKASWQPVDLVFTTTSGGAYTEGNVGIGTTAVGTPLKVVGKTTTDRLRIASNSSPASTDTCDAGEHTWDANYIYVCTSANNFKRAALVAY